MENERNYSFKVRYSKEDEGYIAECPEFPGLSAFGETASEAIEEAEVALELFIETYIDELKELPVPNHKQDYSGQIRIRLPKTLHGRLASMADDEGVSLNTLMLQYLSEGVTSKRERISFEKVLDVIQKTTEVHRWDLGNLEPNRILQSNPLIQGSFDINTGIQGNQFFNFPSGKKNKQDNVEVV